MKIDAVDRVGSDARVWTFLGARPAGWWIRRRLHEVTVHRADATLALGGTFELTPALASDAISEWVELMANQKQAAPALDRGQKLHLHASEEELGPTGEWTIVRRTGQRVCGLTLSDTAAGEEFVVRLQHPCDQVITRFAPATWQMDRGEIVLRAANGQAWRFEEGEDAKWQRVPQTASPLLMVRK